MDYSEFVPTLADLFNLDPRFQAKTRVLSWEEGTRVLPKELGGCWEWTGCITWSGRNKTVPYGRIRRPGPGRNGVPAYVHRYVWELFFGSYPDGFESHHDCLSTLCFHPAHVGPIDPDEHDLMHLGHVRNLGRWAQPGRRGKPWLTLHP